MDRDRWDFSTSLEMASCLGPRVLSGMLRLLAEDYYGWAGGMPDLFFWNPKGKVGEEETARWVEVKGPGDALRTSQKAWLGRLAEWGVLPSIGFTQPHFKSRNAQ